MKTFLSTFIIISILSAAPSFVFAELVFDFTTDSSPTVTTAGDVLDGTDGNSTPFTSMGVTVTVDTNTSFVTSDVPPSIFNAVSGGAGVNTIGVTSGDGASQVDVGEELVFTFTFDNPIASISLTELDFVDFSSVGEQISVTAPGTSFVLGIQGSDDGDFQVDSSQSFSPTGGILFSSGDSITIAAANFGDFQIQDLTFNLVSVPEPTSLLMFGAYVSVVARRRRPNT